MYAGLGRFRDRFLVFHGHRVVVTDHVALGDSKKLSAVDPVSRTLGGSRVPKRVALRQPFDSPRAQLSARTILALDQSRFVSAGVPTTPRLSGVLARRQFFNLRVVDFNLLGGIEVAL